MRIAGGVDERGALVELDGESEIDAAESSGALEHKRKQSVVIKINARSA